MFYQPKMYKHNSWDQHRDKSGTAAKILSIGQLHVLHTIQYMRTVRRADRSSTNDNESRILSSSRLARKKLVLHYNVPL